MSERIKSSDKEKEADFLRKSKFAIAMVQGSWDKSSNEMLKENFLPPSEEEIPDFIERGLRGTAFLLFGEGSIARAITGKSVRLSERDRGIIIINDIAGVPTDVRHDWEVTSVLAGAIASGQKFDKISGSVGGNIKKFAGFVVDLVGRLGEPAKEMLGDHPKRLAGKGDEMVEYLKGIYSGSTESLLKNKADLEQKVLSEAGKRIMRMDTKWLMSISNDLKIVPDSDPVLASGIGSARQIFAEILKSNQGDINEVLDLLSQN